jgi:predicted ATPase/DNA-binding winged helix-turn-helix (wHTH) protein
MRDTPAPTTFRFGRFELQPRERRLLADGEPVPLEPRALALLTLLVGRAGQLLTKQEALETVWFGRVVEDGNLHLQISALRKVLGASAIATVAGQGYRFVAAVDGFGGDRAKKPANPYTLPHPIASFIGRENDLQSLQDALETSRLVTLTGIGGSGKTRLAIRLAERMLPGFVDGACFADLSAVAEAERVALAVARAAGVAEARDEPIESTLARALGSRQMLLILDNCEQVIAAVADLVRGLLEGASQLRILAASREPLGIAGEQVMALRALGLPAPDAATDVQALGESEAVRLFVDRARTAAPGFELDAGNARAVAEICRRLDGIPLAIELAAARMKLLTADQVCDRLGERFRLLIGSSRAISRHQTLLATIQSSYDYLTAEEQSALQRLAVFVGGCTLEAATWLIGAADDIATLAIVERLVDKSLVQVDRAVPSALRYGMLETMRHFALDRLVETGADSEVRERHLAYFLAFAKQGQANFFGAAVRDWLARVDAELPNLLAAHAWCDRSPNGVSLGLELAVNLRSYWLAHGSFALGQRVYDEALARSGADPEGILRGRTLYAMGQHAYVRGRLRDSIAPTASALAIARAHGDDELAVYCLDRVTLAHAWLGDLEFARTNAEEELAVATRTGSDRLLGFAMTAQGAVCRAEGNLRGAAEAYERALGLFAGADLNNQHNALVDIARCAIGLGMLTRAREALTAALVLIGRTGMLYRGHFALEVTSRLAAASGDWLTAARFQGASDAAVDKVGGTRTWFDDAALAALHARVREVLGEENFGTAYDGGRALAMDTALGEAQSWLSEAVG